MGILVFIWPFRVLFVRLNNYVKQNEEDEEFCASAVYMINRYKQVVLFQPI